MKRIFVTFLAITALFAVTFLISCEKEKTLDVVNDTTPVSQNQWRTSLVSQLQSAENDTERSHIMAENGVQLTAQLTAFLRRNGYPCPIDTIIYKYGSGEAMDVASGDGNAYSGEFTSQPYAVVEGGDCFRNGLSVFILCFNGTFSLSSRGSSTIGGGNSVFTIEQGKGINHYVDYPTAIWLAENFDLALYKGKGWKDQITPEEALSLEGTLDVNLVAVKVFPGDVFDLNNMTLNGIH